MVYSSTSKDYKFFNKRTLCVKESIHVIFDDSENQINPSECEDSEFEELIPIQRDDTTEYDNQGINDTDKSDKTNGDIETQA